MRDEAQRVLDALMDYDADNKFAYPILAICNFFNDESSGLTDEDYEALTVEEEKQVINGFLESAY